MAETSAERMWKRRVFLRAAEAAGPQVLVDRDPMPEPEPPTRWARMAAIGLGVSGALALGAWWCVK